MERERRRSRRGLKQLVVLQVAVSCCKIPGSNLRAAKGGGFRVSKYGQGLVVASRCAKEL